MWCKTFSSRIPAAPEQAIAIWTQLKLEPSTIQLIQNPENLITLLLRNAKIVERCKSSLFWKLEKEKKSIQSQQPESAKGQSFQIYIVSKSKRHQILGVSRPQTFFNHILNIYRDWIWLWWNWGCDRSEFNHMN